MKAISRKWVRWVLLVVPLAAILTALLILQPWSSPSDAQSIKARAYEATSDIHAYRMTISGISSLDGVPSDSEVIFESEYVSPACYHVRLMTDDQLEEFIIMGKQTFVKSSRGLSIDSIAAFTRSFSSMLNAEMSLGLVDQLTGIQALPDENIEGVNCFHYSGRIDAELQKAESIRSVQESYIRMGLKPSDEAELEKSFTEASTADHQIEFWIGKDDCIMRQMKHVIQVKGSSGRDINSNFIQKYYDFNQPIIIDAPLDSAGRPLPGWQRY